VRPFGDYVQHVCAAIRHAGRLDRLDVYYFHNTVAASADRLLLDDLLEPFGNRIDAVLARIRPLATGRLFLTPQRTSATPFVMVLENLAPPPNRPPPPAPKTHLPGRGSSPFAASWLTAVHRPIPL